MDFFGVAGIKGIYIKIMKEISESWYLPNDAVGINLTIYSQQKLYKISVNMSTSHPYARSVNMKLVLYRMNCWTAFSMTTLAWCYYPLCKQSSPPSPQLPFHVEHGGDLASEKQLPATLLVAVTLACLYKERQSSSRVRAYQVRSDLEITINLLHTTRPGNAAEVLRTMMDHMFQ